MRNPADLDAGAIILEMILEPLFNRAVIAVFLHVDEVDDDQAGKVAQAKLASDFFGRLQIGVERRLLDRMLFRRASGVNVDRDQRLRLVDDDVAAGFERDLRLQHAVELRLDAVAHEDGRGLAVWLHHLRMAGHQHAHEVLGLAVALIAGDKNLVDVLVVEIAHGALY